MHFPHETEHFAAWIRGLFLLHAPTMNPGSELVTALLTGRTDVLSEETTFLFARCGLLHLFSAAGFHLAAAARLADALSLPLRRTLPPGRAREAAALAARLLLLLWVARLMGWGAPMVRAFAFVSLRAGAKLFEIEADRLWLLVLSLLAGAVLDRSGLTPFLWSASALAGALFVQPRRRWAIALGPWLFTLPLTIFCFGLFPLLGPLWTLTIGVAVSRVVLPLALAGRLATSLGLPAEALESWAGALFARLAEWLSEADALIGGAFWVRAWPWALLSFSFLYAMSFRRRRPRLAFAVALGSLTLAWAPLPALSVLDVGQGDSIFLRTAGGTLLTDTGPPGLHGRPAPSARRLEAFGTGTLGDLLLTHFDLDHRGGLDSLLARHPVAGALWFREEDLNDKAFEKVAAAAERAGVPVRFLQPAAAPAAVRCWLAPFPPGNDSSPLCRALLASGESVLLTGDMSAKAEEWFVRNLTPFPTADFLKVAHHGSRTSSSLPFLTATGAGTALVSVGARNRYGHPTPEALVRLAAAGMQVERTDREGDLNQGYCFVAERCRPGSAMRYFSALIEESMRPFVSETSRTYPGRPATAR